MQQKPKRPYIRRFILWLAVVLGALGWFLVFARQVYSDTPSNPDLANQNNFFSSYNVIYKPNPPSEPAMVRIASVETGYCSCVAYAKALTGFSETIGLAKNWPVNSSVPVTGGVVILDASKDGHVAYITDVTATDFGIKEANYSRCALTVRRILLTDPTIVGYWSP